MAERVALHNRAFAKWPAFHLRLVQEQRRDVAYGIWVLGNDYRNKTRYYGAYPPGYLARVMALFPTGPQTLRDRGLESTSVRPAFSGSLPAGQYVRLDIRPELEPEIVGSVYDARKLLLGRRPFRLVVAD